MKLRQTFAYLTFPVLLFTFVGLAAWGLDNGMPPASWGVLLTVLNFTVILGVEQVLPRNPRMNVFRDRQSLNDIGHGLILAVAARPLGGSLSVVMVAVLAGLRGDAAATWWPDSWFFEAQLLWGLLFYTFMDYWTHRALHSVDRLWWFHAVHHDTPQMHIMKSGRLHLGEELWGALLRPVPLLILGAPAEVLVWMELLSVFLGNLVHSNVDQRFPSWAHYCLPTVQLPQSPPRGRPPLPGQQLLGLLARLGRALRQLQPPRTAALSASWGSRRARFPRVFSARCCSPSGPRFAHPGSLSGRCDIPRAPPLVLGGDGTPSPRPGPICCRCSAASATSCPRSASTTSTSTSATSCVPSRMRAYRKTWRTRSWLSLPAPSWASNTTLSPLGSSTRC